MSDTLSILARATESYYSGTPLMSDSAFDTLLATLPADQREKLPIGEGLARAQRTQSTRGACTHPVPMLSLNNSAARNSAEQQALDALRWLNDIRAQRTQLLVQPKLDGMSILVTYERGRLTRIETRGDGYTGTDITDHVLTWSTAAHGPSGLPLNLREPVTITLHGELYLPHRHPDLARYASPCAAAAIINGASPTASPAFAVHTLTHHGDPTLSPLPEADLFPRLRALGLATVPTLASGTLRDLLPRLESLHARAHRLAPVDGIVLKLADLHLRRKLSNTKRAPRWALALKRYYPSPQPREKAQFSTRRDVIT